MSRNISSPPRLPPQLFSTGANMLQRSTQFLRIPAPRLLLPQLQFRRTLRTTPPDAATPLPITAHGPPPKPPLAAAGEIRELRRKQRERAAAAAAELAGGQAQSSVDENPAQSSPPPAAAAPPSSKIQPKIGLDMKSPSPTPAAAAHPKVGASPGQRRFWKDAWVQQLPNGGGYLPHLDTRPLKTPKKRLLTIPPSKPHLAHLIAHEWNQLTTSAQATRAYLLPLTQLASRVVDLPREQPDQYARQRAEMVDMCMKYLDTDTLLCLHPPPNMHMVSEYVGGGGAETLRGRQLRVLAGTLAWIDKNVFPGIVVHPLDTAQGFLATNPQSEETKARIRAWVEARGDWELVGLERCVVSSKSLLVGIRLVAGWGAERERRLGANAPGVSNNEAEEEDEEATAAGVIPPTDSSFIQNRGTNTPSSHTTPPHPRPEVAAPFDSPEAEPGIDVDPLTGGITGGDPAENSGTNTNLAPEAKAPVGKGEVDVDAESEDWGIEEAARAATLEVAWQTEQWGEVEDTHDVEREDVRRGLGAGWCLVAES